MAMWDRKMQEWVIQVDQKFRNMKPLPTKEKPPMAPESEGRSYIYRIPANFRMELQADDYHVYRPYRVSFGPYFHGDESCRASEHNKEVALLHFLRRSYKPLEHYLKTLAVVVEDLKDAYDQLDRVWKDDPQSFLRMMILDGCFLLELLRAESDSESIYGSNNPVILRIHENHSEMELYRHDMLLLENQLPMLLLGVLLTVNESGSGNYDFNPSKFLEESIATFFSMRHISTQDDTKFECLHILDAYRKSLVIQHLRSRKANKPKRKETSRGFHFNIPSATGLHNARIGFTTNTESTISFERTTLRLPQIIVDSVTKSRFLNIIAFEQLHTGAGNEVASYVYFMRSLIQGANDVSLLQSRGIINTALPSDEVAQLFYRLSKGIFLDPDHEYFEVGRMVGERYNKMSNEWRKDLFQTYLRSPWTVISVIAATLLFTLATIQTVYTVLSYVNRN